MMNKIDVTIKKKSILFFDLDGTLIDTNNANRQSYNQAIELVLGEKTINKNIANRTDIKTYYPNLSSFEYEEIIKAKQDAYNKFLPLTKQNSTLVEILLKFSTTNITYLISNCRTSRAIKTLKYHNLYDKFHFLFFKENSNHCPTSNKYINAISKYGLDPDRIIAFENEEIEIKNAIIAGINNINPISNYHD